MNNNQQREDAISMQDMLVARATGGSADDKGYRELRDRFMATAELHDLLPTFVRTSRHLDQFWAYIQREAGGYKDRREHIWAAFDPLLRFLEEAGDAGPATASSAKPHTASQSSVRGPTEAAPPKEGRLPRAFISYSTKDMLAAAAVKVALGTVGINCFMAHDDIQVSEEWRERILEELKQCELFIPLLSKDFTASEWAPQEIGAIAMRDGVAIVPLSLDGTIPFGFIAKYQGAKVPESGVDPESILAPLAKRYPRIALPALIRRVSDARSFRSAEGAMRPLVPHFSDMTVSEVRALVRASTENGQVWDAHLCRTEFIPELLRQRRADIPASELRPLEYQLEHDRWYIATEA